MIHLNTNLDEAKGWSVGPWNSGLQIPIGFATVGIDLQHYHAAMYEVYLVARGESTAIVNETAVALRAGDVLVVEPDEVHTFTASSPDYFHFVIQTPFVVGDKQVVDSRE